MISFFCPHISVFGVMSGTAASSPFEPEEEVNTDVGEERETASVLDVILLHTRRSLRPSLTPLLSLCSYLAINY